MAITPIFQIAKSLTALIFDNVETMTNELICYLNQNKADNTNFIYLFILLNGMSLKETLAEQR